jgi:hypothetical protein
MMIDASDEGLGPDVLWCSCLPNELHGGSSMNTTGMERTMSKRHSAWRAGRCANVLLGAVLVFSLGISPAGFAEEKPQTTFETPEAAAEALVEALGASDLEALLTMFDRQYKDELLGGDEAAARVQIKIAYDRAQEMYRLRPDGEGRRVMLMGKQVWPMPFPLVEDKGRWRFDTEAGLEEVINRRIGRNELNAISVLRAYVAAQDQYASADRDGDEVLEYAQRVSSRTGRKDGLYWETAEGSGEEPSPFGPLVADAHDYLVGRDPGDPYMGYYFKILTRQGLNVPGGRHDYIINGNMIAGFAMLAFPADHGNSGIMTFVVNSLGQVHEKDLGEETDLIAGGIDEYNPGESWQLMQD